VFFVESHSIKSEVIFQISTKNKPVPKKNYSPFSCQKIIALGLCKLHPEGCFKSRAKNGKFVSPNPIRFAYSSDAPGKVFRNLLKKWSIK